MSNDDEQLHLLREIARWTREAAVPAACARVEALLDTDPKKRVYEALAKGDQSLRSLEKATGVRRGDISAWVKVWDAEGIVETGANLPKASFTLRELGIQSAPHQVSRARAE